MNSEHKIFRSSNFKKVKAEGVAWFVYALLVFLFSLYATQNAQAEDSLAELTGHMSLVDASGNTQPALHLATQMDMDISGLIAKVTVLQSFTNPGDDWKEGIYVFPLDEKAAVNGMEMMVGERRIEGRIQEKAVAQKLYQQAKAEGKKASLVSQQRPNMFRQKVANIPPGETISVRLIYTQRVDYLNGEFSVRVPLTLTQRYLPRAPVTVGSAYAGSADPRGASDEEAWALADVGTRYLLSASGFATPAVSDGHLINPPFINTPEMSVNTQAGPVLSHRATVRINLAPGFSLADVQSLYHDVDINKSRNGLYQISLLEGDTTMDRDFVLEWRPTASSTPQAAVFKEQVEGDDYLLLMLLPPQGHTANELVGQGALSRDLIFVVDTSGSMQGTSIAQAKQSVQFALQRLQPADRFNLIEFDSSFSRFSSRLVDASPANIHRAVRWVESLRANNGTEMFPALEEAFDQLANSRSALFSSEPASGLQQIVFITDGAVGNEQALHSLIHRRLGNARLFTVGIGSAPNTHFMSKAAQFGRGANVYIGDSTQVNQKMNTLFGKLESTLVSNITVQWPQQAEVYPQRIPDLYAGEPLLLAAKTQGAMGEVRIKGQTASAAWVRQLTIPSDNPHSGVAQVWAKAKVDALEDTKTEGADPEHVRQQVLDVALTHQLITAYTSFVAIEQVASRPIEAPVTNEAIVNMRPAGQTVAYPKTATSGTFTFILGIVLLLSAVVVQVTRLFRAGVSSLVPSEMSGVEVE